MDVTGQKAEIPIRYLGFTFKKHKPQREKSFANINKTYCLKTWGRRLQGKKKNN